MYSGIYISQTDARPMYLQIMEQIQARIAAGDWPAGKELPSIRALAAALSVSVITIKRAYLDLENEGVIVTRHGKGSFVAEVTAWPASCRNRSWTSTWPPPPNSPGSSASKKNSRRACAAP